MQQVRRNALRFIGRVHRVLRLRHLLHVLGMLLNRHLMHAHLIQLVVVDVFQVQQIGGPGALDIDPKARIHVRHEIRVQPVRIVAEVIVCTN